MDRPKENRNLLPPVLTRVLGRRAAEEITEQDLVRFRVKWSASAAGVKLSTQKSVRKAHRVRVTILSVAASVAVVFCGLAVFLAQPEYRYLIERSEAVYGGATASRIAYAAGSDAAASAAAAALAARLDAIRFTGGVCDCGHENPSGAYIEGDAATIENRNISWEIKALSSNLPVSAGGGPEVTEAFAELKSTHSAGRYTLYFYIEEGKYHIVTMARDFEIS